MKADLKKIFLRISDDFMLPTDNQDEWVCRGCGEKTPPIGPVVHKRSCPLNQLYIALQQAGVDGFGAES